MRQLLEQIMNEEKLDPYTIREDIRRLEDRYKLSTLYLPSEDDIMDNPKKALSEMLPKWKHLKKIEALAVGYSEGKL